MNKMPEVAKLLGVELNEEFKVEGYGGTLKITEEGPVRRLRDGHLPVPNISTTILLVALADTDKVKKLPFRPKKGETYYFVSDTGYIGATSNVLKDFDCIYIAFGNCFRSEAEAEANKDAILTKFEEIKKEMEG